MAIRQLTMRGEIALHIGTRVVSSILSFYLFSMIARLNTVDDTKRLYFLLFALGFFIAAHRSLATVSAGIDPNARGSEKLIRIHHAMAQVIAGTVFVVPIAAWALSTSTLPLWVLAVAVSVIVVCGFDVDLMRAAVGRRPLSPTAFAIGTALAVGCISWPAVPNPQAAYVAVLLQWLPVCMVNIWNVRRLATRTRQAMLDSSGNRGIRSVSLLAVAFFDGVILNLPFLLGEKVTPDLGVDVAVAVRLFIAALMLFPLVLHWSNTGTLQNLNKWSGASPMMTYMVIQVVAGLINGAAFGLAHTTFSGKAVSVSQYAGFVMLLVAYCAYATVTRFKARLAAPRRLLPWLLGLMLLFAVSLLELLSITSVGVLAVTALQAGFLVSAGFVVASAGRESS